MRSWRHRFVRLAAIAIVFALSGLHARTATAHPLGLSSVNRYLGVELGPDPRSIRIAYLLDFAELPAYAEIERLDADHDGAVQPAEREAYLAALLPPLVAQWTVEAGGTRLAPRLVAATLEAPPGQGGLSTLRVMAELTATTNTTGEVTVRLRDPAYSDRPGWRELGAGDSAQGTVVRSSIERRATPLDYARGVVRDVPRVDDATFVLRPRTSPLPAGPTAVAPRGTRWQPRDAAAERLAGLLRGMQHSAGFVLATLALAFAFGAGHALSPGHGKALVAAYLVGRRGTPRDAVVLGATVTATHTVSVFLLGLFALTIEHTLGTARLLRGLEVGSGLALVVLAASQLPARWRLARGVGTIPTRGLRFVAPRRAVGAARVASPRPGAAHTHDHAALDPAAHARLHAREAVRASSSWRELLWLGISGGLVPCPGALVVLLTAIALHRLAFGLALVAAFSLGLATVLTAIGLVFVLARRRLEQLGPGGRWMQRLPFAASLCVMTLGALIAVAGFTRVT